MKKPQIIVIKVSMLFLLNLVSYKPVDAKSGLHGPIIVSYSSAFSEYVFEDIGSGKVWKYKSQQRIDWYTWEVSNWTSDGCHIVISSYDKTKNGYQYYLLPILSLKPIPMPLSGSPRWSPDGKSVFYSDYSSDTKTSTLYVGDAQFQKIERVLTYPEWILIPTWLSNNEILFFRASGQGYIWNRQTKQIQEFTVRINPQQARSEELIQTYSYQSFPSPNYKFVVTGYSTLPPLDTRFVDPADATDYKGPRPGIPGFDLYSLADGLNRHIDLDGKVGNSVIWSPSGKKIILIPEPEWYTANDYSGSKPAPNIYIYDVANKTTALITNFTISYNNPESFGFTRPQWSPDEKWLSVQTNEYGAIVFNIDTREIVKLKFDDIHEPFFVPDYDPIFWSPVMVYTDRQCEGY